MRWTSIALALVPSVTARVAVDQDVATTNGCNALKRALPDVVSFPLSIPYESANNYWSNQQKEVRPACFVSPRNTTEVAKAVKILTCAGARFSVKGGGHTSFAGAASSDGGVTIEFSNMKAITLKEDRKSVSLEAGVRWIEVMDKLDPMKLAVVGGRAADVGVSGLILGGGLSYFSEKYGMACDNVLNFEVVLSSGKVVNASPTSNSDLYWALRGGGGSNFGVVTRFDIVTFDQGEIWASDMVFPGQLNQTLIKAYTDLALNGLPKDNKAHTYMVLTRIPALGGYAVLNSQFYSTPQAAIPEIFQPLQAIPGAIVKNTRNTTLSAQAKSIDEGYGQRQTWWDQSVGLVSPDLFLEVVPLWQSRVDKIVAKVLGVDTFLPFLTFQPLSTNVLKAMQRNGGNAMGLDPAKGPLMIVQLASSWTNPLLDDIIEESWESFIEEVQDLAKKKGVYRDYVYMNYGGESQNVLASYGKENFARLKSIAAKYDAGLKFQKLWKGYFQF